MFPFIFQILMTLLVLAHSALAVHPQQSTVLSKRTFSLSDRYAVPSVNEVFKDNILLTLAYLDNKVANPQTIDWNKVTADSHYEITLKPGSVFAFHDEVLPKYSGKVAVTTNAHFDGQEGFKSDGYLFGDGVCHLASFINWTAQDAGLTVEAPTRHDFANIPDVPKQYGVAIYSQAGQAVTGSAQNLYITNNKSYPVVFAFTYKNGTLSISVEKA